jgi:hypothetical protein
MPAWSCSDISILNKPSKVCPISPTGLGPKARAAAGTEPMRPEAVILQVYSYGRGGCSIPRAKPGTGAPMSIIIFRWEHGDRLGWLRVNSDGSVTYHEENTGHRSVMRGTQSQERQMTVEEAQTDWASFAEDIAEAQRFLSKINPLPAGPIQQIPLDAPPKSARRASIARN